MMRSNSPPTKLERIPFARPPGRTRIVANKALRAWPPRRPRPLSRRCLSLRALCITRDECDRSLDLFVDALAAASPDSKAL